MCGIHLCSPLQDLYSDTSHAQIGQEMTSQWRFELSMSATGIFTIHFNQKSYRTYFNLVTVWGGDLRRRSRVAIPTVGVNPYSTT